MYKRNGFTLAELLIVVAIIAVLVAIAIPVFTSQLEKSREAVDAANIRSLYGEVMAEAITSGAAVNVDGSLRVPLKQKEADWQTAGIEENLYSIADNVVGAPSPDGSAWVSYDPNSADAVVIHFEGGTAGGETGESQAGDEESGDNATTYTAGQQIPLFKGEDLKKKNLLIVNIPADKITITNTITIEIHKNPGQGGNQTETKTITLSPGEAVHKSFPIDVKNNGSIQVSFSGNIDKNVADALLSCFTAS